MLIYRNAKGVHGQRKFGNPWVRELHLQTRTYLLVGLCDPSWGIWCTFVLQSIRYSFKEKSLFYHFQERLH